MNDSKRFDYVKYDAEAMGQQMDFKYACLALEARIENMPPSRARALALTKLEEVYMWCGKALRDAQLERNAATESQEERDNS